MFEKAPQVILDTFEVRPVEGSFEIPSAEERVYALKTLDDTCAQLRRVLALDRPRRIWKQQDSQEPKHKIRYVHIRKMYCNIGLSMADIAKHFKMSRVTIRKILRQYEDKNANVT